MGARLSTALEYTLDWEGGFSDREDDPGGRTQYGINERNHPEAWVDGPPTVEDAHDIYRRSYWSPLRCGDIRDQRVGSYVFDTGVNQGISVAAHLLQRSVNLLDRDRLSVDGVVGPKTLEGTNDQDPDRLIHVLVAYRADHHRHLAENRSRFRTFLYGWLRRDFAILRRPV